MRKERTRMKASELMEGGHLRPASLRSNLSLELERRVLDGRESSLSRDLPSQNLPLPVCGRPAHGGIGACQAPCSTPDRSPVNEEPEPEVDGAEVVAGDYMVLRDGRQYRRTPFRFAFFLLV